MSRYHYTNTEVDDTLGPLLVSKNMVLKLFIDCDDPKLKEKYKISVEKHNSNITKKYPDSGFDLFCNPQAHFTFCKQLNEYPDTCSSTSVSDGDIIKMDFCVKTSMVKQHIVHGVVEEKPVGFYMFPRSSTGSKSPLRLANSIGIIDSGYRGNLMSVFDVMYDANLDINYSRFIQLCSGDLRPFQVKIVDSIEDLGITNRGDGGFGSTGK
jgi:dUTPase